MSPVLVSFRDRTNEFHAAVESVARYSSVGGPIVWLFTTLLLVSLMLASLPISSAAGFLAYYWVGISRCPCCRSYLDAVAADYCYLFVLVVAIGLVRYSKNVLACYFVIF